MKLYDQKYSYYGYRRRTYTNTYALRKRIRYERKKDGTVKKRILHVPINKKLHLALFERAMRYKWPRCISSFGGHRFINPSTYVRKLGSPSLMIHADIKDCFPSITSNMAKNAIQKYTNIMGDKEEGEALISDILQAAFVKLPSGLGDFLAQGPNISPLVSNCVLYPLDLAVTALIKESRLYLKTQLNMIKSFFDTTSKEEKICEGVGGEEDEAIAKIKEFLDSCIEPTIKYARYADNMAIFFWGMRDSYKDLRAAKEIDRDMGIGNFCEQAIKSYMGMREFLWHHFQECVIRAGFSLNKKKTNFRRPNGRKAIRFVGYTLNDRPRPSKSYVNNLRAALHNFEMYLRSIIEHNLIKPHVDKKWIEQIKGKCVWVYTADPLNRRITKCVRNIIELEPVALGTQNFRSLKRFLGLK